MCPLNQGKFKAVKTGLIREKIRRLSVKIQFLKPCKATTLKPDLSKEFEKAARTKSPISPEAQAYFALSIVSLAKTEKQRNELYKDYKKVCEKVGIDSYEFSMDVSLPKFRCDYRTKVFVTYFASEGYEIKTDSEIPLTLLIDSFSDKRQTEMLPGEKTYVTFIIPENAKSWHVWVPK